MRPDLFTKAEASPAGATRKRRGMGGHQSRRAETETWLTPPWLLDALGHFDLDPCAAPEPRPWPTAEFHYTEADDGLNRAWPANAMVWCNPPYGDAVGAWLARCRAHPGPALALVFARTETAWFHEHVWNAAAAVLFLEGRLHFHHPDGRRAAHNAGAPSCIVAYGAVALFRLMLVAERETVPGKLVLLEAGR